MLRRRRIRLLLDALVTWAIMPSRQAWRAVSQDQIDQGINAWSDDRDARAK